MSSSVIPQSKPRPVLFILLTLLSGIVIGAGATLILVGPPEKDVPPGLPEEFSRRMVEHLTRELNLTTEQQEKITPVVETHMQTIDQFRDEARPKIRQELDDMNNEIMALLDEHQQQLWKDSIERMQTRFRDYRDRRGPGPGDRREGDRRGRDWDGGGDRPEGDPNSPFRRRRPDMRPGMMPPPGSQFSPDPNDLPRRPPINQDVQL